MPPPHPHIPPASEPIRKTFDPWNSSSTGHQRAESRLAGSTSWRQSRSLKLSNQFAAGAAGGKRLFDTIGAGSKDFGRDGRLENGSWERGAPGLREKGWRDVGTMLTLGSQAEMQKQMGEKRQRELEFLETKVGVASEPGGGKMECETVEDEPAVKRAIFENLCIYINGSTAPAVGDHRLKQLLAANGAKISIALGRRSVTHVIVGRPNGKEGGAGGGLSGSKIQKEIRRVRGCGIKFVGVEWALESLKAGKRVPESRYVVVDTAPNGVGSVKDLFAKSRGKIVGEKEE